MTHDLQSHKPFAFFFMYKHIWQVIISTYTTGIYVYIYNVYTYRQCTIFLALPSSSNNLTGWYTNTYSRTHLNCFNCRKPTSPAGCTSAPMTNYLPCCCKWYIVTHKKACSESSGVNVKKKDKPGLRHRWGLRNAGNELCAPVTHHMAEALGSAQN